MPPSTFADTRLTALHELQLGLVRHLQQCHLARGRWFGTALWAERAHALMAPRFVTTVVGAALLLALCSAWA